MEGEEEFVAPPMQLVEKRREMDAAESALNIQKEVNYLFSELFIAMYIVSFQSDQLYLPVAL